MGVKLLTLDDLYDYFSKSNKDFKFSAKDEQTSIIVQIPASMTFAEEENQNGLLPVHLKACHTGLNINRCVIDDDVMKRCMNSIKNRPILGYIHKVDGEFEFGNHRVHVEEDDNGNKTVIYDEIPVGIIPESCNAELVTDKDNDKNYLEVDGFIFESYTRAADILRNKKKCSVSVEVSVLDANFNAKTNILTFNDFTFDGVTILGKDDEGNDVQPAMVGSNITIKDFSKENNSVVFNANNDELLKAINELNNTIENFNHINNPKRKEEGNNLKFEELLKKFNVTADDIKFDHDGMTDEELEKKFEEVFGKSEPAVPDFVGFSVNYADGTKKDFSLSLDDMHCKLSRLVNRTYAADNTWYNVIAYPDDLFVVMEDFGDVAYRQNYAKNGDDFELVGDRIPVHRIYVTAEEDEKFRNMNAEFETLKENYSKITDENKSLSDKVDAFEKAEVEAKKQEIIHSEEFAAISDTDEVKALVADTANFEKLSVDELTNKMNGIVLTYAKSGKLNFSKNAASNDKDQHNGKIVVSFSAKTPEVSSRYGGLND